MKRLNQRGFLKAMAFGWMAFIILGCGPAAKPSGETRRMMTSFYPIYIMARKIAEGVPGVTVVNLTKPSTGCLHDYTLTPDDLLHHEKAMALVVNGAGMEGFLTRVREWQPQLAVIERDPGSEPSAGELADTIATVKKAGIRALFAEPQYPAGAVNTIAKETGARVHYMDPCVTGPDALDAYLVAMEANRKVLADALGK